MIGLFTNLTNIDFKFHQILYVTLYISMKIRIPIMVKLRLATEQSYLFLYLIRKTLKILEYIQLYYITVHLDIHTRLTYSIHISDETV